MFHVYQEATPHELWNCEFPGCSVAFIPYFVWGVRHHCRVCGITVCHDHCAKNINLSSRLLQPNYAELSTIHSPILATSLSEGDLPQQLVFKYACFTCTSRTIRSQPPPTGSSVHSAEAAGTPKAAAHTSQPSEAETLRAQLTLLQAELASKTSDVSALSDMMHVYSERLVALQDTIEMLESQLRESNTESATNAKKRRQLSELRDELQRLTPKHSYYNADSEESGNNDNTSPHYTTTYTTPPSKQPYDSTTSTHNNTTEEQTISDVFYSMLSQAYEGIVAATPSVLKTPMYTTTAANTGLHRGTNERTPCATNSKYEAHSICGVNASNGVMSRNTEMGKASDSVVCASTARVLFPPIDSTYDTVDTSEIGGGVTYSIDGVIAVHVDDEHAIQSTCTATDVCSASSPDNGILSRAQSAHVDYCDIYACISIDEYMTHSGIINDQCISSIQVHGAGVQGVGSGDVKSANREKPESVESVDNAHEKNRVNIMGGVFTPNPLMTKRKSI